MSGSRTEKELAFLKDLYVATDWGERFAELFDEHVELPKKGRVLYVASGTGGHAMALQERAGEDVRLTCVDESEECLELARAKAAAVKAQTKFHRAQSDGLLRFAGDEFDLVVGEGSLVAPERLPKMLAEMVRVASPGGTVALSLVTASSFGEFFSIYWEALRNAGLEEHEADVEELITQLPTVSEMKELAAGEGLDEVSSWTRIEEFDYKSGEEFLNSPLITDFLLRSWLESLPDEARGRVSEEIARIIDEEQHGMNFALSIKATLIVGRKNKTM